MVMLFTQRMLQREGLWTPLVFSKRDIQIDQLAEGGYLSLLLSFYVWGNKQFRLRNNEQKEQKKVMLGPQIIVDGLSEEYLRMLKDASTFIAEPRRT